MSRSTIQSFHLPNHWNNQSTNQPIIHSRNQVKPTNQPMTLSVGDSIRIKSNNQPYQNKPTKPNRIIQPNQPTTSINPSIIQSLNESNQSKQSKHIKQIHTKQANPSTNQTNQPIIPIIQHNQPIKPHRTNKSIIDSISQPTKSNQIKPISHATKAFINRSIEQPSIQSSTHSINSSINQGKTMNQYRTNK